MTPLLHWSNVQSLPSIGDVGVVGRGNVDAGAVADPDQAVARRLAGAVEGRSIGGRGGDALAGHTARERLAERRVSTVAVLRAHHAGAGAVAAGAAVLVAGRVDAHRRVGRRAARAQVVRAGLAVDRQVGVVIGRHLRAAHADVLLAVAGDLAAATRRSVRRVADAAHAGGAAGPVVAIGVGAGAVARLQALHARRRGAAAVALACRCPGCTRCPRSSGGFDVWPALHRSFVQALPSTGLSVSSLTVVD